jgi:hypothetical protein
MGGYKRSSHRTPYRIGFDDGPYAGLEFVAYGPSYRGAVAAVELVLAALPGKHPARWLLAFGPAVGDLGAQIVEWNLQEDDGTPVPLGPDSMLGLDVPLLQAMYSAWESAAAVTPSTQESATGDPGTDDDRLVDPEWALLHQLGIPQEPLPPPATGEVAPEPPATPEAAA